MDENNNRLLPIGEASEYIGVSVDTIRRWVKKGKLKTFRSPGGHRYFLKDNLDEVFGRKYERDPETKPRKEYETDSNEDLTLSAESAESEKQVSQKLDINIPQIDPIKIAPVSTVNTMYYPVMPHYADDIPPFFSEDSPKEDVINDLKAEEHLSKENVQDVDIPEENSVEISTPKSILEPEITKIESKDENVKKEIVKEEPFQTEINVPLTKKSSKNNNGIKIFAVVAVVILVFAIAVIVILTYPSNPISPIP